MKGVFFARGWANCCICVIYPADCAGLLHFYLKNFTHLFVSCRAFQYSKYAATGNGSA